MTKQRQPSADGIWRQEPPITPIVRPQPGSGAPNPQAPTPPQHSDKWLEEILDKLHAQLFTGDRILYAKDDAKAAILTELNKREAAARMDITKVDLNWQIGDLVVHYLPEHIIKAALAQLHKEQPENVKGSEQNE